MHCVFVATNKNKNLFQKDPSFIYRCENMAKGLEKNGHTTELIHLKDFDVFTNADVVIFHRPSFSIRLWSIIRILSLRKIFFMMDVDDFIFDILYAKESPAYINNILPCEKIEKQFENNLRAFKLFSYFSVSTLPLAEHITRLIGNSKTVVLSNAVFNTWKEHIPKENNFEKKIISYFPGTRSHDKDFTTIQKPLELFLNRHPKIVLKITGQINFQLNIPKKQIIYNEKVPFCEHWKNYQNIWLNLAPLEYTEFNACKSALKVIEAGYFNIPTLCIENQDTKRFVDSAALIASNEEEFYTYLERCMDKVEYLSVIENLQNKILELANVENISKKLIEFIENTDTITFARKRRKNGSYDKKTLELYQHSWRITGNSDTYIEYCMFCRDLGYALSSVRYKNIKKLYHTLKSTKNADLLLSEYTHSFSRKSKYLKEIFNKQRSWVDDFTTYLGKKEICIVGNAASIKGKKFGNNIDCHDIVMRFNHCGTGKDSDDLGKKIDIWVSAPNVKHKIEAPWIILSGPNMIYRGANWKRFSQSDLNKLAILSVPLNIWKELVAILHAPPSAGILLLYWIKTIRKSFKHTTIVGFDLSVSKSQYHYADPKHEAVLRHNWTKEKELLNHWIDEGLKVLV
ncbi:MAG: glycosyltransferase family 29 protein [Sulfurovum sp.]|nr:glycosyltransferase family 29 protein [Sulfurovum sp.]